jgi:hypothetical protein
MTYDADRAVFILAIIVSEAEEAMKAHPRGSERHNRWKILLAEALRVFPLYDRMIDKNAIYQTAAKVIDIVNRERQEGTSGLRYNFPSTKFAATNSAADQLAHFLSENDEIFEHGPLDGDGITEEMDMEIADRTHSGESYWRVRTREKGLAYVLRIFARVEEKNCVRGYYEWAAI